MSDFSTAAELDLVVPESELRNVRQQIQSAVGTTEIGMTDGGTMSAQSAQGGGRARRRARRSYRMEQSRTEYLEDAVIYLEEIEDKIGEGGGGLGMLDELLDTGGDAGGAAALGGAAAALGGAATSLTGSAAALGGAAAALTASDLLSGESVDVEKPGWIPLAVEDPESVPVDAPDSIPVEDLGRLPVEREPLPVEEIDPIAVDISVSSDGSQTRTTTDDSGGSGDGGTFSFGGDHGLEIGEGWLSLGGEDGIQLGNRPTQQARARGPSRRPGRSQEVSVSAQNDTRVSVDVSGVRDMRDDIVSAFEDAQQETKDELQSQIDAIESELDGLRREITRR